MINAQRQNLHPLSFRSTKMSDKRAETNVFCALCHSNFANRVINAQRQNMVILRPLSFGDNKSRGGRRQIMVIPYTFSPSRGDRVRWHAKTNYGHSAPCRPGSIASKDTQRQIMVILRLVSNRRNEFDSIRMMCRY